MVPASSYPAIGLVLCALSAPASALQQPVLERISFGGGGALGSEPNNICALPSVSDDGRIVVFQSYASNLVAGDTNNALDVFAYDRITTTTQRMSVATNGAQLVGNSIDAALCGNGSCVTFTHGGGIWLRNRVLGTTEVVSVGFGGGQENGSSFAPSLSRDGRFVCFLSTSTNLVPGGSPSGAAAFVRDRSSGTTQLVSLNPQGQLPADAAVLSARISADGSCVAFTSASPHFIHNDMNGAIDVFVRDIAVATTERVSVSSQGAEGNADADTRIAISADGRFVAFASLASNLVPNDVLGVLDVFVRDRQAGTTDRASVSDADASVGGDSSSSGPSISADGRLVAFASGAGNLVAGVQPLTTSVFLRDRVASHTKLISAGYAGAPENGASTQPALSSDGQFSAFQSGSTNLVAQPDTNGLPDIYFSDAGSSIFVPFCVGESLFCPCNNGGSGNAGCAGVVNPAGGLLRGIGVASVSTDTVTLIATGLPPSTSALFFQGDAQENMGYGAAFGEGLRCAGGLVRRIATTATTNGNGFVGFGVAGSPLVSVAGLVPSGGATLYYQAWYRSLQTLCSNGPFNLTNGLQIAWQP